MKCGRSSGKTLDSRSNPLPSIATHVTVFGIVQRRGGAMAKSFPTKGRKPLQVTSADS